MARKVGLTPTQVRVLVALAERNRPARSDELECDLRVDSSVMRGALLTRYQRRFCSGSPRKRGTRTTVTLTEAGLAVAEMALTLRGSRLEPEVGFA